MTLKMPNKLGGQYVGTAVEQNDNRAYQTRLESMYKRDGTATAQFLYQSAEHGEVTFSATGSATITQVFSLAEKQSKIVYAAAHAVSTLATAHVTDVTGSEISIAVVPVSGTGQAFSGITTAAITVFYQVVGSNP